MKTTDILNAINDRLLERWPDRTVYVDVCPVDFDRPSFWLTVEKSGQTDANRLFVRRELQIRLTIYDQMDEHYEASWFRLVGDADDALTLLTPPLTMGDRRLKLDLKALPRDPDRAYIQIGAVWMDDRAGMEQPDTPPADTYMVSVGETT